MLNIWWHTVSWDVKFCVQSMNMSASFMYTANHQNQRSSVDHWLTWHAATHTWHPKWFMNVISKGCHNFLGFPSVCLRANHLFINIRAKPAGKVLNSKYLSGLVFETGKCRKWDDIQNCSCNQLGDEAFMCIFINYYTASVERRKISRITEKMSRIGKIFCTVNMKALIRPVWEGLLKSLNKVFGQFTDFSMLN